MPRGHGLILFSRLGVSCASVLVHANDSVLAGGLAWAGFDLLLGHVAGLFGGMFCRLFTLLSVACGSQPKDE